MFGAAKRVGVVYALGVLMVALPVRAEEQEEGAWQLIRADAAAREPLRIAPKLLEVGRVGEMRVGDPLLHVTGADPVPAAKSDMVVQTIAPHQHDAVTGRIDPEILRSEVARMFDRLRTCRLEAARAQRIAPAQVIAGELELQWIIRPDGTTADLSVRSQSPTDPRIIECVRRGVLVTQFTRPTGGPIPVDYRFAFAR